MFKFFQLKLLIFCCIYIGSSLPNDGGCVFDGHKADCLLLVKNVLLQVEATINHCHNPIDVTFDVQNPEYRVNWHYTFVSSNKAESRHIFDVCNSSLNLFVSVIKDNSNLNIKAQFVSGGKSLKYFLDSSEGLPSSITCDNDKVTTGYLVIGILISVLVVCGLGVFIICYNQRKVQLLNDQIELVDNMETGRNTEVTPYMDSTSSSSLSENDKDNSDCLNQNEMSDPVRT